MFASLAQTRRGEMLFAEEMAKPDAEVCFVKAAGYVAMHRRPDLSRVDDALAEIDELAVELEKLLPPIAEGRFPLRTLKQISRFMFDPVEDGGLGFVGNGSDFYDPRNSCLDEVLATRKGIPITLSLIYMELARRVGVEMVGVNLPGRFMVRPVVHEMEVLVDCFNGGEILFVEDDSPETSSEKGTATPKTSITIDRGFFGDQTIRPRQFFTRVLTNLKQIYFNKEEYSNALLIVNYQQHCSPTDEVKRFNVRDGGICLFLLKRYNESAETLSGYLAECLAAETAEDESEKDKGKGKASPQAHAAKKLAAAKDRAQVSAMIETAQTQVKRLAVEKMVNQAVRGNGEEDEHMTDKSKKKNDQVPFEGDSFRIADEVSRRSTDEDDASDDESFGESN